MSGYGASSTSFSCIVEAFLMEVNHCIMGLVDRHAHAYSFVCVFRVYSGGKILYLQLYLQQSVECN